MIAYCQSEAQTTGLPKNTWHLNRKIHISVQKCIFLLSAIPLHICLSSRSLQLAHLAHLIGICCYYSIMLAAHNKG